MTYSPLAGAAFANFEKGVTVPKWGWPAIMNNPFIYGAYAVKIVRLYDNYDPIGPSGVWQTHFQKFLQGCEIKSGLINRFPDGSGGVTSHDEIMGAAYLDSGYAGRVLAYLDSTDGEYNNTGEPETVPEQFNVFRMVFLRPFLLARAGYRLSFWSQALWAAFVFWDMFTYKPNYDANGVPSDCGGRLRIWIMLESMAGWPLANLAVVWWQAKMNKLGVTPALCLKTEPGEFPIYGQFGPTKF